MKTICSVLICALPFLFGCSEKKVEYEDQFNLHRFEKRQFDLYNPILNTLKLDSTEREKHPDYYDYDAYYDSNATLLYLFYRSESYGYLRKLDYNEQMQLKKTVIYPILVSWVHEGASVLYDECFYVNGKLAALRDELNDVVIIVDEDSVIVYKGVLESRSDFKIGRYAVSEYYISYLNGAPP